jgi:predicted nucleic acid-binding protein
MLILDTMVAIHLAKITLLEKSCEHFKPVIIPEAVYAELLAGSKKGYGDVRVVEALLKARKLSRTRLRNKALLKRAWEFNVQRGEAEVLACYWQEQADYLASDDDNLRRKRLLLNVTLIGTPAIILSLYRAKRIDKEKLHDSLRELRKIGWLSSAVIDTILMEAQ